MTRLGLARALCGAWLCAACGSSLALAPTGPHPKADAVPVPFPPPPAKVEEVAPQPHPSCVWVDGYWEFTDRWEWQAGEWVVPRGECRLARAELRRDGGELLYSRPRWYPSQGAVKGPESACPRPPACTRLQRP